MSVGPAALTAAPAARRLLALRGDSVQPGPGIAAHLAAELTSPTSASNLALERSISRVRWLGMLLCAISALFLDLGDRLVPVYALIALGVIYNLSFRWLVTAGRPAWLLMIYAYGVVDTVIATALVGVTGGADSPFYLAYFLIAVHAAIRFGRWVALLSSTTATLCYLMVIALGSGPGTSGYVTVLLRIGFIVITAIFAGFLADRARAAEVALARQLDRARELNRASTSLTESLEWSAIVQQATAQARLLVAADVAILQFRPARPGIDHADMEWAAERVTDVLPGGAYLAKVLLQSGLLDQMPPPGSGEMSIHDLAAADDLFGQPTGGLPRASVLRAPVFVQGSWAADFLLLRSKGDHPFAGADADIVRAFVNQASLALENARLYRRAREQAATDPITGLPNHRALKERLDEELARTTRHGRSLSLLMLDIDHFKVFNDAFGHAAGDDALRAVAAALRRSLRHSDYAARYAGEEFVVVLPDTGLEASAVLAERLRRTIAGLFDEPEQAAPLPRPITVSIGVATFPEHGNSRDLVLQAADLAMYLAKHIGRNQVCLASDLSTARGIEALLAQVTSHLALPSASWGPHVVTDLERRFRRLASLHVPSEPATARGHGRASVHEPAQQHTIQAITALAVTIDAKDHYTEGHSRQVSALGVALACAAGCSDEVIELVRVAGLLHDIGKIGIPEAILNKPTRLSDEEWALMRSHPDISARILAPISALAAVVPLVRHHHERWDGQGYPLGLHGEDIPLGARIIAICDAYDTMVSDRPYRRSIGREEALTRLAAAGGTQFDPALVQTFTMLPLDDGQRGASSDNGVVAVAD